MQLEARAVLEGNQGQPSQVTLDELSAHLSRHGVAAVPHTIRESTKLQIRQACDGIDRVNSNSI
jgi:hypothetical protein